jgi:hypothetical protein
MNLLKDLLTNLGLLAIGTGRLDADRTYAVNVPKPMSEIKVPSNVVFDTRPPNRYWPLRQRPFDGHTWRVAYSPVPDERSSESNGQAKATSRVAENRISRLMPLSGTIDC